VRNAAKVSLVKKIEFCYEWVMSRLSLSPLLIRLGDSVGLVREKRVRKRHKPDGWTGLCLSSGVGKD
jgi:hypothetical protein